MIKNSNSLQVVDISGYSFSGKSAVFDLLCEFEGYFSYSKEFEFDLIRVQGGILDLKNALVDNWSPVRSSEAVRNFYKLIRIIGGPTGAFSKFTTSGAHYDRVFPGFSEASKRYIESLIDASWQCEWPFPLYSCDTFSLALKKITRKFGFNKNETVYLSRLSGELFIKKTQTYFNEIFSSISSQGAKAFILNNAFEPFYPEKSIELIEFAKSIVVDRDPRDVYLSALYAGKVENVLVGEAAIGGSIENFIKRFKLYHNDINKKIDNIYRLNFESLALDYHSEVNRICLFLGEDLGIHKKKGSVFNPSISAGNIGLWKSLSNKELIKDIRLIEFELPEFCLNSLFLKN